MQVDHADDQPEHNVDDGDDDAGHGVAAHELGRAVHRAIEVRLALDHLAALARFLLGNDARVQVRVHAHLLAGHSVQCKARRHFRDTRGALGDHHELDYHQDDEYHDAHKEAARGDEVAKGVDDVARVCLRKYKARGCDVEAQAEEREYEQQ